VHSCEQLFQVNCAIGIFLTFGFFCVLGFLLLLLDFFVNAFSLDCLQRPAINANYNTHNFKIKLQAWERSAYHLRKQNFLGCKSLLIISHIHSHIPIKSACLVAKATDKLYRTCIIGASWVDYTAMKDYDGVARPTTQAL